MLRAVETEQLRGKPVAGREAGIVGERLAGEALRGLRGGKIKGRSFRARVLA